MAVQPANEAKCIAGMVFGRLRLLQRVRTKTYVSYNLRKQWRVECSCGARLTVPEYYLIRKQPAPKTNCGACIDLVTNKTRYKDIYMIWYMMHVRCTIKAHVGYKYYGGRGIRVCEEWKGEEGFERFLAHIGARPSKAHTIDRIDNNGNYEPGNVRWATPTEQRANQRSKKPSEPQKIERGECTSAS